jgi:Ca-activated chloride channel family protein
MRLGSTPYLRFSMRVLAIAALAAAFQSSLLAQDNPMDLPPRTAPPPPSVQKEVPEQPPANGQQPTSPSISESPNAEDNSRFVFKKQVQEVFLHATVIDESGRMVTNLTRNDFQIVQNGQPESITSFQREDVPVAIGIVVDNSGSMRDKRARVSQAVMNLIKASNPQDEVFVVNFGQTPYLDQDFTSDPHLLEAALHQTSTRGSTALYDAVVASSVHLRNNPRLSKKVLIVITDGQDNMSRETLQDAMRKLQSNKGATVYAIGLTDDGMTHSGRQALQDLAASTGGVCFFPQSLDEVDEISRTVAHDIRSQYTIAYNPGPNIGKGYQAIRVEAHAPGHPRLTVRTRNGYYPGETVR